MNTFITKIGLVDCNEKDCPNCPSYFYVVCLADETEIETSKPYKDRAKCESDAHAATEKLAAALEKYIDREETVQEGYLH